VRSFIIIISVFLGWPVQAWSVPAQVVIIRHGEKIRHGPPGLSPKGCQRANQLPGFFKPYEKHIVAIYAQQPKGPGGSVRALETIAPMADILHLPINNRYKKQKSKALAREILSAPAYDGGVVVVSWEHRAIIKLTAALGVKLPKRLQSWPSSLYDQAWIVSFEHDKPSLKIVAEHVLPTDVSQAQSGVSNWGVEPEVQNNGMRIPSAVVRQCAKGNRYLEGLMREWAKNPIPGF
jgi:hypothetical protein